MRRIYLILCLCLSPFLSYSQGVIDLMQSHKQIELPFEYKNNLMIVEVTLNRMFPLKFIFDTGAENTILAKREITDLLNVPYEREFKLLGSDMKTELTAYLVRNIHFKSHDLILPAHSMLVLEEDYFRFEEIAGIEVHGIMGADIFRSLVVSINYEKRVITFKKAQDFRPPKDFEEIDIEVSRSKPYLKTNLNIQKGRNNQVKLLLDSGAMLTFIVNTNTDSSLVLPPNVLNGNLGAGLGGYLEGFVGRVDQLELGQRQLKEVITHFQDISMAIDTSVLNGRNGIIGNQLLNRFHVIIDYPKEKLYLKPNRRFNRKFEFDKSGLVIIATDVRLSSYIVHEVIPNSPASEAGLLKGDKITVINRIPSHLLSLTNITDILRKRAGKRIRLKVKRDTKKMRFRFTLRKLI